MPIPRSVRIREEQEQYGREAHSFYGTPRPAVDPCAGCGHGFLEHDALPGESGRCAVTACKCDKYTAKDSPE